MRPIGNGSRVRSCSHISAASGAPRSSTVRTPLTPFARRGNVRIGPLCREIHVSSRQLERLFQEQVGISPKQLASLVRYQYLWRDIMWNPHFQALDAVHQYGYTDQAHLARDFKRFHSLNIPQAREYARRNV